jgi:predicted short-subunit dehydrogenase-like oxidoreductase (DUF2520 family)
MKKLSLNIIGCGHLGKSLARLWADHLCFEISGVLNRSIESSVQAVNFIGSGVAISSLNEMSPAQVYLIATPDNQIIDACQTLVESALLQAGNILFHCSGALSSEILGKAREQGVFICSVHPVKSFAEPAKAVESFTGTYCGVEGDLQALEIIEVAMQKIGASLFHVQAENKVFYHAASVMVCNYLTALMEVGLQTYQKSGLDRDTAVQVMQPMVRETLDNVFRLGTVDALTGPIARGDNVVVNNQMKALTQWYPAYAGLYASLGEVALQLSQQKGTASTEDLAHIQQCLADSQFCNPDK